LKKLHLAGNRISRLRTTARVLGQFSHMTLVDLRGNPLTVGFYPPMAETRVVTLDHFLDADPQDNFILGRVDRERDHKYIRRLDVHTKMLRRTLEILILGDCPRLRVFDGLDVDMSVVIRRDSTWQALVNAGVLRVTSLEGLVPEDQNEESTAVEEGVLDEQVTRTSAEKFERKSMRISMKTLTQTEIIRPAENQRELMREEEPWLAEDSFA